MAAYIQDRKSFESIQLKMMEEAEPTPLQRSSFLWIDPHLQLRSTLNMLVQSERLRDLFVSNLNHDYEAIQPPL